jgi:hypothetical protein
MGYLDTATRLGLIGAVLYYILFVRFLTRGFSGHPAVWLYIVLILVLESGHNYSKSGVFLPIIVIGILAIVRGGAHQSGKGA